MAAKLIAQKKGASSVDVFLGREQALVRAAAAGIIAPLSEELVPNLKDVASAAKHKSGMYVAVSGVVADWVLRTDLIFLGIRAQAGVTLDCIKPISCESEMQQISTDEAVLMRCDFSRIASSTTWLC